MKPENTHDVVNLAIIFIYTIDKRKTGVVNHVQATNVCNGTYTTACLECALNSSDLNRFVSCILRIFEWNLSWSNSSSFRSRIRYKFYPVISQLMGSIQYRHSIDTMSLEIKRC